MKDPGQLFRIIRSVELPDTARYDPEQKIWEAKIKRHQLLISFAWPSGQPCVLAEMFLLERADEVRVESSYGGTLRAEASKLSHIVRFCYHHSIDFRNITSADFQLFVDELRDKNLRNRYGEPLRGRNMLRLIIDTSLRFLIWLQENFPSETPIVGTRKDGAKIRLTTSKQRPRGRHLFESNDELNGTFEFVYKPGEEAAHPKRPIQHFAIAKLWDVLEKHLDAIGSVDSLSEDEVDLRQEFLRERRLLTFILLQETGLRPGELCAMRLDHQIRVLHTSSVRMITLKRGDLKLREVAVSLEAATALLSYIHARQELVENLPATEFAKVAEQNRLFLTQDGLPLTAPTLTKEFWRIAQEAGLSNRACMSMFRHRFITRRVAIRLKDYRIDIPTTATERKMLADLMTVLGLTAQETGHKRVESLLAYVAPAYEELGLLKSSEEIVALDRDLGHLRSKMNRVWRALRKGGEDAQGVVRAAMDDFASLRNKIEKHLAKL
ncbi:site-specific integrase [Paraburkholderia dilworthii]|uniref:site-specific integrase n=1 Tax=Paraburkholderia dilworthii TaxID=948106 RepID=UPI0004137D1D|nr:site-specific integrase [Paraburkholderia dilworthii]